MHVAVVEVGDRADVGQQLLASADVPPVLSLVDRDDDGPVSGGQPPDGVDGGRIDVRGADHRPDSLLRKCAVRREGREPPDTPASTLIDRTAGPRSGDASAAGIRTRAERRARAAPEGASQVGLPKSGLLKRAGPLTERHDLVMGYIKSAALEETGYVVLDRYNQELDPKEWLDIEYNDWKSSGDTRFAPLASAFGEIECNGFWNHKPPRTDKDGVWIDSQVEKAPNLTRRAQEPGANVGRCRVIELQPTPYGECLYNLHQDDNNRLNPDGTGWVVRGFFNLTDDKDSFFVLRENRTDPAGRDAHRAAGRRAAHHRHAASVARRDPRRHRAALQPHHVVDVGTRARRVHREVPRREPRRELRGRRRTSSTPATPSRPARMPRARRTTRRRARPRSTP